MVGREGGGAPTCFLFLFPPARLNKPPRPYTDREIKREKNAPPWYIYNEYSDTNTRPLCRGPTPHGLCAVKTRRQRTGGAAAAATHKTPRPRSKKLSERWKLAAHLATCARHHGGSGQGIGIGCGCGRGRQFGRGQYASAGAGAGAVLVPCRRGCGGFGHGRGKRGCNCRYAGAWCVCEVG